MSRLQQTWAVCTTGICLDPAGSCCNCRLCQSVPVSLTLKMLVYVPLRTQWAGHVQYHHIDRATPWWGRCLVTILGISRRAMAVAVRGTRLGTHHKASRLTQACCLS